MYLIIGGDFVVTESNKDIFAEGNGCNLLDKSIGSLLANSEKNIFNLEGPITDYTMGIKKNGPCIRMPLSITNSLQMIGIDVFSLANNHIMDYGESGLRDTITALETNGISSFGAGEDVYSASEPMIFEFSGKSIGILSCTETEFSCASEKACGANGYDPYRTIKDVSRLKKTVDYLIILYHGGKEEYRYPAPYLVTICHELVDSGADLVLCQHSHCIGCEELYNNKHILYGQGNFLFDYNDKETWKSGLLVSVDDKFSVSYIPIMKNANGVRIATDEENKVLMEAFKARSKDILDDITLKSKYTALANESLDLYLAAMARPFQRNIWYRLVKLFFGEAHLRKVIANKYDASDRVIIENYINCETHRDLFIEGLKSNAK